MGIPLWSLFQKAWRPSSLVRMHNHTFLILQWTQNGIQCSPGHIVDNMCAWYGRQQALMPSFCPGLGCFWGAERLFWRLPGVFSTQVGFAGGFTPNPTSHEVGSGNTLGTSCANLHISPHARPPHFDMCYLIELPPREEGKWVGRTFLCEISRGFTRPKIAKGKEKDTESCFKYSALILFRCLPLHLQSTPQNALLQMGCTPRPHPPMTYL